MIKGNRRIKTITTLLSILVAVTITNAVDFNGDGKPDYLLYNPSTRQLAICYLNNNSYIGGAPSLPAGWSLVAEADFNGDGKPDYLLYNTSIRQTGFWYMNNNVRIGAVFGPTVPFSWIPATVAPLIRWMLTPVGRELVIYRLQDKLSRFPKALL